MWNIQAAVSGHCDLCDSAKISQRKAAGSSITNVYSDCMLSALRHPSTMYIAPP